MEKRKGEKHTNMLSFISMHQKGWKNHSYVACCGVSDRVLWQMMADNYHLCIDSGKFGIKNSVKVIEAAYRTLE